MRTSFARADVGERQAHLARLGGETDVARRGSEQPAAEALASVDRPGELDPRFEPAEPIVIFGANQRTIDARRADLEHVGAGDRVGDIEKGRDRAADLGAVLDRHRLVVAPLGHDLKRRPAAAGDDHPHEAIAHRLERRLDRLRDTVRVDQETGSPCISIPGRSGLTETGSATGPLTTSEPKQKVGRRPTRKRSAGRTLWTLTI